MLKFSLKIPWGFEHCLFEQLFIFHYMSLYIITIAYQNYSNFCTRKCIKQHYVYCNYNDTSMIYINSKITLLSTQDVHKTSRTSSESLMYVQFTSCVYGKTTKEYCTTRFWTIEPRLACHPSIFVFL